jgi:hypothetical protein
MQVSQLSLPLGRAGMPDIAGRSPNMALEEAGQQTSSNKTSWAFGFFVVRGGFRNSYHSRNGWHGFL